MHKKEDSSSTPRAKKSQGGKVKGSPFTLHKTPHDSHSKHKRSGSAGSTTSTVTIGSLQEAQPSEGIKKSPKHKDKHKDKEKENKPTLSSPHNLQHSHSESKSNEDHESLHDEQTNQPSNPEEGLAQLGAFLDNANDSSNEANDDESQQKLKHHSDGEGPEIDVYSSDDEVVHVKGDTYVAVTIPIPITSLTSPDPSPFNSISPETQTSPLLQRKVASATNDTPSSPPPTPLSSSPSAPQQTVINAVPGSSSVSKSPDKTPESTPPTPKTNRHTPPHHPASAGSSWQSVPHDTLLRPSKSTPKLSTTLHSPTAPGKEKKTPPTPKSARSSANSAPLSRHSKVNTTVATSNIPTTTSTEDKLVELNIGGYHYRTFKSTLSKVCSIFCVSI